MSEKKLVPPFTEETARAKVQKAEDLWNTKDPEKVVMAYTEDSEYIIYYKLIFFFLFFF